MVEVRKAKGDTLEFYKVHSVLLSNFLKKHILCPRKIPGFCLLGVSPMQFYKNLSTCLEDVVWKTDEDIQEIG